MARDVSINQAALRLERSLEHALDAALRPVGPRPEYLDDLRSRLMHETVDEEEGELLLKLALSGVGVVSGVLLILASVRVVQNMRRARSHLPAG